MDRKQIAEKANAVYPVRMVFVANKIQPKDENKEKREGYIRAMEEFEVHPKIQGWVARNDLYINGSRRNKLFLFFQEPYRDGCGGWRSSDNYSIEIDEFLFPELGWIDKPMKVELIIRES